MRFVRLAILALAVLSLPATAATQQRDIVVRGDAARVEIERILDADNLDTSQLSPRDVVETMSGIPRGEAPEDFWEAYQTHLRAWERLATAVETVQQQQSESTFVEGADELVVAQQGIDLTFDEVERVARRYGARLPTPRGNILPTV
ncbi:hypothetical protein RCO27_03525 [Sphingosinicella sp. LHD-64]|uniref:hypothetical protein n=1 Tax=Sphingosinicella sp. LHD-64 TaxID=3072139 RepID=UPI00280CEB44|nr:hypothetical protein [Sphingosinicella sp. LHD-64]MDQ8755292.1 hypothetical protein [Sphingosinicella sp. LHD-64]